MSRFPRSSFSGIISRMGKKKRPIKTRDHLLVRVINGATKAGVQVDRKKQESRDRCRKKDKGEEE